MCFQVLHWWWWTHSSIYKMEEIWRKGDHLQNSPKSWLLIAASSLSCPSCFLFPFSSNGGKKSRRDMRRTKGGLLLSRSLASCTALVAVKGLLRWINFHDKMPPSRVTCRILSLTWSGDQVSSLLDLGWSDAALLFSEGFLRVNLILLVNVRRMVASIWLP